MHAAVASLRSAPRPPAWRPGPARRAHSPSAPRQRETDASLSLAAAPARPPAARHAHAVRPGCAGSAHQQRALTPLAPFDCTAARSSAGHGRTRSRGRTPADTRAGHTPRSAAPPRHSCARRLLAPRPGVRYLFPTGSPLSHTRARLQGGPSSRYWWAFRLFRTRATADSTSTLSPLNFSAEPTSGSGLEVRQLPATHDQESALPGDHQHAVILRAAPPGLARS